MAIVDDCNDLMADAHKDIASNSRDYQLMRQYDLLITGYAQYQQCEYIIPFHIISICKSYLPLELKMIDESNQSNFYTKSYQAYNIFDNPIGPLIIDVNQRRRQIIIRKLYTFVKNNYIEPDDNGNCDVNEYKLVKYDNGISQHILHKKCYVYNGYTKVCPFMMVKSDNILNEIAHLYDTNVINITRLFRDVINIDLNQWFE